MKRLGLVVAAFAALGSLSAVEVPRKVLELPRGVNNCRNSEGDFAVLKDGRILFVYSHYLKGGGGDHDTAILASRVSSDGGKTWSTNSVQVIANEGGMNVMSVSLLRLKEGPLALFYLVKNSEADCRPAMRISTDEGETWGERVMCIPDSEKSYYVLNNSRALRLKSGRLVLTVCEHAAKNGKTADWKGKLCCYLSDDVGRTWRRSKSGLFETFDVVGKRVTTQEPGAIELKDGRVLMYARTDHGRQWFYYSSDGCETWTAGEPGPLLGPCGPATLKRLGNGDMLAIWNDHEYLPELAAKDNGWGQRAPLTVGISKDDGKTWPIRRNIETDLKGWFCYIAALELEGRVMLGYCAGDGLSLTRLTEMPLEWLYAAPPLASDKAVSAKDGVMPRHFGAPRADHRFDNRAYTGIPSIEVAANGRMWATWFCGITPREDNNSYVVLATSGDGGETWKEVAVCDPDGSGPIRAMDPMAWAAPDGTLRWSWSEYKYGEKNCFGRIMLHVAVAEDAGAEVPKWRESDGKEMMRGVMLGNPFVFRDGTWAMPIAEWYENNSASIWTSNDRGETWQRRGGMNIPAPYRDAEEHTVIEMKDGRLWCLARTLIGEVEGYSSDGGRTWTEPVRPWFHQPVSRMAAMRLKSGNIVIVKHGKISPHWCDFEGRNHLWACISKDEGRTWAGEFEIEPSGCSYPNLAQGPDGMIYVIYDQSRGKDGEINFASFREEDLLKSDIKSKTVRLRRRITKSKAPKEGPAH